MKKYLIFIYFILGLSFISNANYDVNKRCQQAWMLLMDFEMEQAKKLLAEEIQDNPQNYYAYYLDQSCDAFQLFINGTKEDYQLFIENYEMKRAIMDDQDKDSPYYLACSSEMEIQLGLFNILEGEEFSGLKKMYSAYKDVYRNLDRFPDFAMSRKLDGFFNVAIGNLPPFVKWAVSFFGVKANLDKGFGILQDVFESQKHFPGINAESAMFMIFTAKINKTPEKVYQFTKDLDSTIAETYLHQYFRANVAYRTGHNEEALTILYKMNKEKNIYTQLTSDYLLGKVLMRKLDDQADFHLKRYLKDHRKLEYFKEIQYQLALYDLFQGNLSDYERRRALVIEEGMDMQERDREALYDAQLDYPVIPELVKAKLLLDGGYLLQSKEMILNINPQKLSYLGQQLDYWLIKAKIEQLENNPEEAIEIYKKVVDLGEDEDYSNASEAAMLMGQIYKSSNQNDLADEYFKKSLKLYKSEYYEYIEDKARKGKSTN